MSRPARAKASAACDMSLFRRRSGASGDVNAEFWSWWSSEGRGLAEQSIGGQLDPQEFAHAMTRRVRTLGDLGWELAPGELSEHVLVITSEGTPEVRGAAR